MPTGVRPEVITFKKLIDTWILLSLVYSTDSTPSKVHGLPPCSLLPVVVWPTRGLTGMLNQHKSSKTEMERRHILPSHYGDLYYIAASLFCLSFSFQVH